MPLQSLVLLPPLQGPMLPRALLPLIRHDGCDPAERMMGADGEQEELHLQAGAEQMAARAWRDSIYRLRPQTLHITPPCIHPPWSRDRGFRSTVLF